MTFEELTANPIAAYVWEERFGFTDYWLTEEAANVINAEARAIAAEAIGESLDFEGRVDTERGDLVQTLYRAAKAAGLAEQKA